MLVRSIQNPHKKKHDKVISLKYKRINALDDYFDLGLKEFRNETERLSLQPQKRVSILEERIIRFPKTPTGKVPAVYKKKIPREKYPSFSNGTNKSINLSNLTSINVTNSNVNISPFLLNTVSIPRTIKCENDPFKRKLQSRDEVAKNADSFEFSSTLQMNNYYVCDFNFQRKKKININPCLNIVQQNDSKRMSRNDSKERNINFSPIKIYCEKETIKLDKSNIVLKQPLKNIKNEYKYNFSFQDWTRTKNKATKILKKISKNLN